MKKDDRVRRWVISAIRRMRRGLICIVLVLASIALCGILAEVALGMRYGWHPVSSTYFASSGQPPYYRLKPSTSTTQVFRAPITVTIDPVGHRRVPNAPSADRAATNVHIVGDSQVFGWGLSDEETIPAKLQDMLGGTYRVINHGLPGTGPYYYASVLASIPSDDWVVLIQTEQNDLVDTYSLRSETFTRCGLLMKDTYLGQTLPCWLIRSYCFNLGIRTWIRVVEPTMPLPLPFNTFAPVAARILHHRVASLYAPYRDIFGRRLVYGFVPWDGLVVPARRSAYAPKLDHPQRLITWSDDLGLEIAFMQVDNRDELFLPGDPHLSAKGTSIVAQRIAQVLGSRHDEH